MKAAQMAVRMAQVSSQGSNNTVQQPRPVSVPPSQPQITTDGIGTGSQPNVGMGQNQQVGSILALSFGERGIFHSIDIFSSNYNSFLVNKLTC